MKHRPEPERIEIELTENVPPEARSHADAGSGDVVVAGARDDDRPVVADQRRLYATASIVGVVALLLGWLIGRSGGSNEVATTSVTTPQTAEAVAETFLPGETLPSAATTTTRPRRTTTTSTLAPPSIETIEIDPRLVGTELILVGSERRNTVVELDLTEQTLTRREVGRSFEPEAMFVGESWIVLLSPGGGATTLLVDGEAPQRVDLGEPWELLWQPGSELFWRPDWDSEGFDGPSRYEQVDIRGEPTGATLELPTGTWVSRIDPLGGLVIEVTGKHYTISESGVSLLGVGELVGLSANSVVLRDCDEQLRCGLFVTDRSTGAVRRLGTASAGGETRAIEPMWGWGGFSTQSISPDEAMAVVILPSTRTPMVGLIDLRSAAVVELAETWWMPAVVWSPDARFAFFLGREPELDDPSGPVVLAYDRISQEIFSVLAEPVEWDSLASRPSRGG